MSRRGGVLEGLVVAAAAVALTVAMTYPLAFGLGHLGRTDSTDGQCSIWNVAWVGHALLTDPAHLFDANIFYPHKDTLAYTEANIGGGLLGLPAYAMTHNPYAAHNSAVLLAFILSVVGAYFLAKYLTGSRPAAAVAAILFAFCPFIYARTAHIQLLMTAGLPFSLLAFHRLVDDPQPGRAVTLGLVLFATALACGYYGVFAALVVGFGTVFYLVSRRYWKNRDFYVAIACAAAISLILIAPVFAPFLRLQELPRPFRALDEAVEYSANWAAYLAAAGWGNSWLKFAAQRATGTHWQEVLFPGIVALSLAAAGVAWWARTGRRAARAGTPIVARASETLLFYGLVGTLAAWLSFGPSAWLYALFYRVVPTFSLLRAPARFGILVTLAVVVFAAVGLAGMLHGRRRAPVIASGVCLLAVLELNPAPLPYREVPKLPSPYVLLAGLPDGPVAEFPFFYRRIDFHRHSVYMLTSTAHWKPLVNGYSDFIPDDFRQMVIPLSSFPTDEAFRILRKRRTRYVVFHADYYDHRSREKVKERLAQFERCLRPLAVEGDVWLYEIVAWPGEEPG